MVSLRPFCALRYNPDCVPDLSDVLAPPYDVIDAEEQERLYRASPHNIVRLILGKQQPADTEQDNRYSRARRDFTAWRTEGILRADKQPALYVVEQAFADEAGRARSRLGFIALLELHEASARGVYRHEVTLDAPKQDRRRLLEAVPANLSPIFCVYPDPGRAVQALLQEAARATAAAAEGSLAGSRLRLWAVTAPAVVDEVRRRLASTAVLIADGHHRFEVAYAKRDRYGALMSYFVSMEDPSLLVRPIHRVIRPPGRMDLQALRALCNLEPAEDLASLTRWLQGASGEGQFGFAQGTALYRAAVRPEQVARWLMAPSVPQPVAALDVSLLHGLILPHLGLKFAHADSGGAGGNGVRYTADAEEAVRAAAAEPAGAAWLLRGIPLQQVYALAAQGLTLPPKSTFFYPKVPSGLTIHPLT